MDIRTAFKIKWLGSETAEICKLLAKYQPLIYVSPAPELCETPPGMVLLPGAVSLRWDLRTTNQIKWGREVSGQQEIGFKYETVNPIENPHSLAAIYEFYFKIYIKHTAFGFLPGTTIYNDIEMLHKSILAQRFISFTRAFIDGELVGGCLVSHRVPTRSGYETPPDIASAAEEIKVAAIDLICSDVKFKSANLTGRILSEAAGHARRSGIDYLQTQLFSPLTIVGCAQDLYWILARHSEAIASDGFRSLLYCDLVRCSYFSQDLFFYRYDGRSLSLHYIANTSPDASPLVALMDSAGDIEKKVYTRHAWAQGVASDRGIECVLL